MDGDISQAVYSGLLKYDSNGNLINDLAESYEVSDDKTTYTFHLRRDATWQDGQKFDAHDVIFTINLLTNPAFKSPLRSNWQGIETDLVDDYTLTFKIQSVYVGFLNNLTFGILPAHLWESVEADKFSLTDLNLKPIGTGPYRYSQFQKDSDGNILSYELVANPTYFEGRPYISKITFNFYSDEDSVIEAYNRKEIMGVGGIPPQKISSLKLLQSTYLHKINIPRYFAVFLNQVKSVTLAHDEVREALSYATNREEIIQEVLFGNGQSAYSPILESMIGHKDDLNKRDFNLDKANQLLEDKGWKKGDDGIRKKDNTRLEINLITADWDELSQTAQIIKRQWEKVGIRVNVNVLSISDFQQNYIRPREYDALLFGQVLGADPDPFSFWHSTQKKDPGLNLSLFGSDETDKLIENGRAEFDSEKRAQIYRDFQEKLNQEVPAIFLYSPNYIYPINKNIQGAELNILISPSKRFSEINKWFIRTNRVWK